MERFLTARPYSHRRHTKAYNESALCQPFQEGVLVNSKPTPEANARETIVADHSVDPLRLDLQDICCFLHREYLHVLHCKLWVFPLCSVSVPGLFFGRSVRSCVP